MKVVLFCGGLGARLGHHTESMPKPMMKIGYRPVMWHLMKYYSHFGHRDFVLALGYKADVIKQYFIEYDESQSNDVVISGGGRDVQVLGTDIVDWRIACIDTGLHSNIGERLMGVREYVADEDVFFANYSDALTDAPLNLMVEDFVSSGKVAGMLCAQPHSSFHVVTLDSRDVLGGRGVVVNGISDIGESKMWINAGFFMFRQEIFEYIKPGEELVHEPFERLVADRQLIAYPYDGFWAPMDTLKDVRLLESLYERGEAPWEIWDQRRAL